MSEPREHETEHHMHRATSEKLVQELIERGVLRAYGVSKYIPGIVRARYEGTPENFDTLVRGQVLYDLFQSMIQHKVVHVATEEVDDPAAPPTDVKVLAQFLTLDPEADLSLTGVPSKGAH